MKRVLSFLLALAMIICLTPATVFGATEKTFTLTAPSDARVQFFNQTKNYVVTSLFPDTTTCGAVGDNKLTVTDNLNGTTTYVVSSTKTTFSAQYSYRVSKDGEVTQAGFMSNNGSASVEYLTTATPQTVQSGLSYDDNSVLLNIDDDKDSNELAMNVDDDFRLRAFRNGWEIIDSTVANHMIEPDFHYSVLYGADVVDVTTVTDACTGNAKDNWATVHAKAEGTALIAVWYDAINVANANPGPGLFGATDPARYAYVLVNVGGDENVTWNPQSYSGTWDAEFDTVYYTGENGFFTFAPTVSGASIESVSVMNLYGTTMGAVQTVAGEGGTYKAPVLTGSNLITVNTSSGSDYMLVRAKKINYTVKNNTTGESETNGTPVIKQGDSVTLSFSKLEMPVPKMSGIYNPGYMKTAKTAYSLNDKYTLMSSGAQYDFGLSGNSSITFIAEIAGKNSLSSGRISLSNMGDPAGNHRNISDEGKPTNKNASESFYDFGMLPDIEFNVAENTEYNADGVSILKLNSVLIYCGSSQYQTSFIFNQSTTAKLKSSSVKWGTISNYTNPQLQPVNIKVAAASPYAQLSLRYWTLGNEADAKVLALLNGVAASIPAGTVDADDQLFMEVMVSVDPEISTAAAVKYTYNVYPATKSVSINVTEAALHVGESVTLSAEVSPSASPDTISWSSDAEAVASVDSTGFATAVSTGSAIIKATAGGKTAQCLVTVTEAAQPPVGPANNDIQVSFRLIGCEQAEKAVDLSSDTYLPKYVTWVSTRNYTMEKGDTVGDLLEKALKKAGLSCTGAESGYVSSFEAPAAVGGYTLSEMDNGPCSGWMFTVNGEYPLFGLNDCILKDGDAVVWHYVCDYMNEVSAWGGSVGPELQDQWLNAEDKDPAKGAGKKTSDEASGNAENALDAALDGTGVTFTDVPSDAYYTKAVGWAVEKGITAGMGSGKFGTGEDCTREQMVTFLWNLAGQPKVKAVNFSDVEVGKYYEMALAWAKSLGITAGNPDGSFGVGQTVTREQVVTFLWNYAGKPEPEGEASFADVDESCYYAKAVAWAKEEGITSGVGQGNFGVGQSCTREQIIMLMFNYFAN